MLLAREDDAPFIEDFSPAIVSDVREPLWYTLRYVSGKEKVLTWLLKYIDLPFQHLVYLQRVKRSKLSVERSWLPGYMFIHTDIYRDNWGQILRMPYALEVLGDPSPLPPGLVDDLALRLPLRPARSSAFSCVAPGTRVRLRRGAFTDHESTVTWADRRRLKVMLMIFNRPEEVLLDISDVEIV